MPGAIDQSAVLCRLLSGYLAIGKHKLTTELKERSLLMLCPFSAVVTVKRSENGMGKCRSKD